jgi:Molecular chaperone (small heat shock protein)
MTLVKFNNHPVSRTIDTVFDEFFNNFPVRWNEGFGAPVNIHESGDGFHLDVSAPGLNKEDFNVSVDKDLLTIAYDKKEEKKSEDLKTVRREFTQRSFKRTFTLDDQVDADNIQAKYENGVLKLYLPKKEQAQNNPRQVLIQ